MKDARSNSSRRDFLKKTALGASAIALGADIFANTTPWEETGLPTRPLGKTGEHVSILCLGGWHIRAQKDTQEAIRMMHYAIGEGLTFFDNAWDYHDGGSEELMGEALKGGMRKKVFLMTKNCDRDYEGSMKKLEDSLRRMKTDYLDLWQFHEINWDNDPELVFEQGGIKAALEAQKAGKVRYIGFTGHKSPHIHLSMINRDFAWDASQMPINVMDAHYRSFVNGVVPVCLEKGIGAIGMKSLGGGNAIIPQGTTMSVDECIQFALSQPIASLVSGMVNMEQIKHNIGLARDFKPLSEEAQTKILAKSREFAGAGAYELFKSTTMFDAPYHKRQHGFRG